MGDLKVTGTYAEDDAKANSNRVAQQFDRGLRRLVKRYPPAEFAEFFAQRIYRAIIDRREWSKTPIHVLVNAIEANCVYFSPYLNQEHLDEYRFNKVVRHYLSFEDPYEKYLLETDPDVGLWLLAIGKQQFSSQRYVRSTLLGRALRLFATDDPLPETSKIFNEHLGFSPYDWIYLCLAIHAHTRSRNSPVTTLEPFLTSHIEELPTAAIEPFFKHVAITPATVRERFLQLRYDLPPFLHRFVSSIFEDNPILDLEDGSYVVVHPDWMFHYALGGLYRTCQVLAENSFTQEFGDSFENYVALLLGELLNEISIEGTMFAESMLQKAAAGRTCDFVIVFHDSILLVECKAVRYAAKLATEGAIRGDNSTGKIADSLEQIVATATKIRNGEFRQLFAHEGKKLVGLTVTFGEIHFANSPKYLQRYIIPRTKFDEVKRLLPPLDYEPQVMSIRAFEDLIIVLKNTVHSFVELLEHKLAQEDEHVGDWYRYLFHEFDEKLTDWQLKTTQVVQDELFRMEH